MPQHVFHDICLHIVSHAKNDQPLETAARHEVPGRKDKKPPGAGENG